MSKKQVLRKFNNLYRKCFNCYEKMNLDSIEKQEKTAIYEKIDLIKEIFKKDETNQRVFELLNRNNVLSQVRDVLESNGVSVELENLLSQANISSLQNFFEERIKTVEELDEINNEINQLLQIKANTIKQTELTIREEELKLKEQDFYNRKRLTKSNQHIFAKIVVSVIVGFVIIFFSVLIPSIKKRIEYNPYAIEMEKESAKNSLYVDINSSDKSNNENRDR